jgi:DNA invertase Pin-like site-specific DNA recombinase
MQAVVYARVSSARQVESLSLPTQRDACEEYCRRAGLRIVETFTDEGESAKTADRPAFQSMLEYCRRHRERVQCVVVYALSRFSRNTADHFAIRAHLMQLGITLRSVTETFDDSAAGELMEGVLAVMARFDNRQRADRTVAGMQHALKTGEWPFRAPLGYAKVAKRLEPDPERAPLIARGFGLVAEGHSAAAALDAVTRAGLTTRRGRPVSKQTWSRLLRAPAYCGRAIVERWGVDEEDAHPAIIDRDTWHRAQTVLDGSPSTLLPRQRERVDFPLRRFARCRCGTAITGAWSRGNGGRYAYYWCPRGCAGSRGRKEAVEAAFVALLEQLRPTDDFLDLVEETVIMSWEEQQQRARTERDTLNRRIAELQRRRQRLREAYIYEQAIDRQAYDDEMARLSEELTLREMDASECRIEELDLERDLAFARMILTHAARLWLELPHRFRLRLQAVLLPEGVVYADGVFRTIVTCPFFRHLQHSPEAESEVVSLMGPASNPWPWLRDVGALRADLLSECPHALIH